MNTRQHSAGLNDDPQLKQWFLQYYVKWLETCENQRAIAGGKGPLYPSALLPFIPFGKVSALPFHHILTTFVASQVCNRGDVLAPGQEPIGDMATIIDEGRAVSPYILFESVRGGIVTGYQMFRETDWPHVRAELIKQGQPPQQVDRIYRKSVTIGFLRRLYALHQDWLIHRDNAVYLIDFFATLFKGIASGDAVIEPMPLLLTNLLSIKQSIKLTDIDPWSALKQIAALVPDLTINGRGGETAFNLGGDYTLELREEAVFGLLDLVKFNNSLSGLFSGLIGLAAEGLSSGWVALGGLGWASKLSAFFLKRRIRALPGKVQLLVKIMGNPFKLLLVAAGRGLLITFSEGLPGFIEQVDGNLLQRDGTQRSIHDCWLDCSEQYGFIHLAVLVNRNRMPGMPLTQYLDYYPQNDFIKYIMRKGALQVAAELAMPFLSA